MTITLLFGLAVGGVGVFHYQEVVYLSQEGARWASVRGQDYGKEVPGANAATASDIYNRGIKPKILTLNESKLTSQVSWSSTNAALTSNEDFTKGVRHTVTVTVTYEWMPQVIFTGPITFSSSTTVPMSF